MVVEKLFGFKKELDSEGIVFCYSGPVSQGLVEEIGDVVKRKMELEDAKLAIVQKEMNFYVLSGNLVENRKKEELTRCFSEPAGKDKEELKSLYKEKLKRGRMQEGKGAGLGLIDMARKAREPIKYCFRAMNADYSFYSSKVVV